MEEITTITAHQFGEGVLVEIIGVGNQGDIAIETIEFDLINSADDIVAPREEVPSDYKEKIRAALSEEGYSLSPENNSGE